MMRGLKPPPTFEKQGQRQRHCLLFDDAGYYVVVVGFGDFAAVEGAWDQDFSGGAVGFCAEVVYQDFAVDLWGVE